MSVDVYHERRGVLSTTSGLKSGKQCSVCLQRFTVVTLGSDGKWWCYGCIGEDEPLISEVDLDADE